jgi:hyperosmotically inducible protein
MTSIARAGITAALAVLLTGCAGSDTRRSTGETIDDSSIASRVKSSLVASKDTDGLDIEVEVDRGRVQLNGFANSAEEKARAEEIARGIEGVSEVDNNLAVVKGDRTVGEYIDDKVLLARVNGALTKDPDVSNLDIEVEVNRGLVQLGGYVDSAKERDAAGAAAQRVEGIERVENNVRVR